MLYPLKYQGVVPASKSLMNRALIVKTFSTVKSTGAVAM